MKSKYWRIKFSAENIVGYAYQWLDLRDKALTEKQVEKWANQQLEVNSMYIAVEEIISEDRTEVKKK